MSGGIGVAVATCVRLSQKKLKPMWKTVATNKLYIYLFCCGRGKNATFLMLHVTDNGMKNMLSFVRDEIIVCIFVLLYV